jgi:hypothetical protein
MADQSSSVAEYRTRAKSAGNTPAAFDWAPTMASWSERRLVELVIPHERQAVRRSCLCRRFGRSWGVHGRHSIAAWAGQPLRCRAGREHKPLSFTE